MNYQHETPVMMLLALVVCLGATTAWASEPYRWNAEIPEKKPDNIGNGKLVLFDVSHGGTQGNADWVIDGAFSDFADALVDQGYTVREYRGVDHNADGIIQFVDDRNGGAAQANEAVITFDAIKGADVFVMAETNRPLTQAEYDALKQYVDAGRGLLLIGDHYNADRNVNSWDSTEVFNGYNRSTKDEFNIGGLYGDLRNPQDASKGWLAENFGLRFRFNAIDLKSGATDVVPEGEVEGVTEGVSRLLTAAGATLAIIDPNRAKGLVYFAPTDPVKSWQHAVEGPRGGKYFGGNKEGPLAAIAKPSAGKAAFLGDSSPVEDNSPKYRREDTGGRKTTHAGWNDPRGPGKPLALNIVNWLATPEAYVGFNAANGHPAGDSTNEPMADVEKDDPDDGRPWRSPTPPYNPWDPATFSANSYGAPHGPDSGSGDTTTPGDAVSVQQALAKPLDSQVNVKGIIASEFNTQFGLKLVDDIARSDFMAVKLPRRHRSEFNPVLNPSAKGLHIIVRGKRGTYANEDGIVNVTSIEQATTVQPAAAGPTAATVSPAAPAAVPTVAPAASDPVASSTALPDPPAALAGKDLRDWLRTHWYQGLHQTLGYNRARRAMYSIIDKADDGRVYGVYTRFSQPAKDTTFLNPINAEHTVPQSFFGGREPMKSDVHHLFPTHKDVNSSRGSDPFGEIDDNQTKFWFGLDGSGRLKRLNNTLPTGDRDLFSEDLPNVFEPRETHEGDLARAVFYFYTMYPTQAGSIESVVKDNLEVLNQWHRQDPPDDWERQRNDRIELIQGNRNPYVDHPDILCRAWEISCQ